MRLSRSEIKAKADEKIYNAKQGVRSWEGFKHWVRVQDTALDQHGSVRNGGPQWSNEDLDPTPPEKRTWRWYNYIVFYWALSFGNWTLGATMVGIGLNWWQAILTIFLSQLISSIAMFFNSRCASVYHIGEFVFERKAVKTLADRTYCRQVTP
jgi:NCS1 family nucleobase:cation symporter-1